jgi:septation ring formation regulator EzrA
MSKGDEMKVSSETAISMPMKNLLSIVAAVAVGVWAYFGVIERLNRIETNEELLRKDLTQATQRIEVDLEKNTEFRIKWPRGEMGTLPADSEQYMLIEHIAGQVEKIQERMEDMMNNGVNIKRLQQDVESLTESVERLKDSNRNIIYSNGNGHKKTGE